MSNPKERARLAAQDFALGAAEHDRGGSFPFENFQILKDADLLALTVPRELGGAGASVHETCAVLETIAQGDASTALVLALHYLMHATIARSRWPAQIRERVARDTVRDGALINALRVEPELGTPARGGMPATTARRVGDGWRIAGHKIYSTGIPALRWLMVWAKTDEAEPRVGTFLVPADTAGIRVVETWDHMGMRASASHDVTFEDVRIPDEFAVDVREPSRWEAPDDEQAAWYVLLLAALYHGVAKAGRDWFVGFVNQRAPTALGAPLATLPRFQEAVGDIDALLLTNRMLLDAASIRTDSGSAPPSSESGLIKLVVTGNAIGAVERAVAMIGNVALSRTNPLERHLRDVLCSRIHTPQNDTILTTAGRAALKAARNEEALP